MKISTIGLDIAKIVFQVHGIDANETVVGRKRLRRSQVVACFKALPPCLIGMAACATAHYWARELTKLGHRVRLMPAKDVKAYVKRNKNDACTVSISRPCGVVVSHHASLRLLKPAPRSATACKTLSRSRVLLASLSSLCFRASLARATRYLVRLRVALTSSVASLQSCSQRGTRPRLTLPSTNFRQTFKRRRVSSYPGRQAGHQDPLHRRSQHGRRDKKAPGRPPGAWPVGFCLGNPTPRPPPPSR